MKYKVLFFLFFLLVPFAYSQKSFFLRDYKLRMKDNPLLEQEISKLKFQSSEEKKAVKFLYAYMDIADAFNLSSNYWLENTRIAIRARKEMPWGKLISKNIWRHFVLPVRVNNEYPDSFRIKYYDELKSRVKGLSWHDAALEVNHWLHEKATYRPSDERTSSPISTIITATGRCGEESTLGVVAYRTIGIPARQVYTPRWAHTDDNHAWVEIYVDGKWQFIGACEPAPQLNTAWFNSSVLRGMLMNTTVFGKYFGPEEILNTTPISTTINVTSNYAPTAKTVVKVLNPQGRVVNDANVRFGLYNYAEFYPLAFKKTNSKGVTSLTTGLGDLILWGAKGDRYGFVPNEKNRKQISTIILNHQKGDTFNKQFYIIPPKAASVVTSITDSEEALNNRRLEMEDSIRNAYVKTWFTRPSLLAAINNLKSYPHSLHHIIYLSEGNADAIVAFLTKNNSSKSYTIADTTLTKREWALLTLQQLTNKDLRDLNPSILQENFNLFLLKASKQTFDKIPFDIVLKYVLNPRILTEHLTAWRNVKYPFSSLSSYEETKSKVNKILEWLNDSVQTDTTSNSYYIIQSPKATIKYKRASLWSKGICFVAMLRTLGIPSRYDPISSNFQYYNHGQWINAKLSLINGIASNIPTKHQLRLSYQPRKFLSDPQYYHHFTLSKIIDGQPQLCNYDESSTLKNTFEKGIEIEEGDYALISGLRLANGDVLASIRIFPVKRDTMVVLSIPYDTTLTSVIGSFNAENIFYDIKNNKQRTILSAVGRGFYAMAVIKANHEPSMHILHDLELVKDELDRWGRPVLLLLPSLKDYQSLQQRIKEFPQLPKNIIWGIDNNALITKQLTCPPFTDTSELPIVILGDTFNKIVFYLQGYNIGIGSKLTHAINNINQ